jgi:hypothetical protein
MVTGLIFAAAGVLLLALVVWSGNTSLRRGDGTASGVASSTGALGNFVDVFDPARARSDQFLKEWENTSAVLPSPDGEDPPVMVDLKRGTAVVRRPRPVSPTPSE